MTEMQMKCFLTLAEELNFTKASKTLCISQSTLSAHISALEKNIGVKLFLRSNKKVVLSPEGCVVYPVYKRAHEMMEAAAAEARELSEGKANVLRIAFIDGLIPDDAVNSLQVIDAFRTEHPSVQVQITSANENQLLEQIDRNQVDVIFSFEQDMHLKPDLTGRMMLENPLCILSEKGRYSEKNPFGREALGKETLIVITKKTGPSEEEYIRQMLTAYDIRPKEVMYVNSMEAKIFCIAAGYGVGVADYLTRLEDKDRFEIHPLEKVCARYGFLYKKNIKNETIRTFFDFLETYDKPLHILDEINSASEADE